MKGDRDLPPKKCSHTRRSLILEREPLLQGNPVCRLCVRVVSIFRLWSGWVGFRHPSLFLSPPGVPPIYASKTKPTYCFHLNHSGSRGPPTFAFVAHKLRVHGGAASRLPLNVVALFKATTQGIPEMIILIV